MFALSAAVRVYPAYRMAWKHERPDERDLVGDGEPVVHLNAVEADGSGADDLRSSASGSERTAPEGSKRVLGEDAAIGLQELEDVPPRVGDENRPDPDGQVAGVGQLAPLGCVDLGLERLEPAHQEGRDDLLQAFGLEADVPGAVRRVIPLRRAR
jgi:hypothetical protein